MLDFSSPGWLPRSRLPRSADDLVDPGLPRQVAAHEPEGREVRVFLDGEDVTVVCRQACADAGVVQVYFLCDDAGCELRFMTGKVEIRRSRP